MTARVDWLRQVGSELGVDDVTGARIAKTLDAATAALRTALNAADEADTAALALLDHELGPHDVGHDLRRDLVLEEYASLVRRADPEEPWRVAEPLVRSAAARLRAARAELSRYEALRAIVLLLRERAGHHVSGLRLTPEDVLDPPPGSPPCPEADPAWAEDPPERATWTSWSVPVSLARLDPADLPDGALVPTLLRVGYSTDHFLREHGWGDGPEFTLPRALARRYGPRLYGAIVELLASREEWERWADAYSRRLPYVLSPALRRSEWLGIAGDALAPNQLELLARAAFEAGWSEPLAWRFEGLSRLVSEHADSPY